MRKDSDFDVTDHIKVYVNNNDKIAEVVKNNEAEIAKIVLGDEFVYGQDGANAKSWDINGEKVNLSVEKLSLFKAIANCDSLFIIIQKNICILSVFMLYYLRE